MALLRYNSFMKGVVACIFAHPDDESFCPSGTIAKLAKDNDVYVLCATKGEGGNNHTPQEGRHIGEIREAELRESAKILGVKEVHFLGYHDGMLSNSIYHELSEKILTILTKINPHTLITFEPRGLSGHLDHIAISFITSHVFEQLPSATKIMQYCISEEQRAKVQSYFIYFPPGYKKPEIDEVVDVSDVWDTKLAAIRVHKSQTKDMERILNRLKDSPKEEYFLIKKK
jgi:N-acetylglucosamine malate deacetylase 2